MKKIMEKLVKTCDSARKISDRKYKNLKFRLIFLRKNAKNC